MFGRHTHPIVGLTWSLGFILIAMTILVLAFGRDHAWILVPVTIAIVAMGIIFGYFTTMPKHEKEKKR